MHVGSVGCDSSVVSTCFSRFVIVNVELFENIIFSTLQENQKISILSKFLHTDGDGLSESLGVRL